MKFIFAILAGILFFVFPDFSSRLMMYYAIQSVSRPHQKDAELIARFQMKKTEFERVRAMITSDSKLERVDDTWTRPSDPSVIGVSPQRIAEYRKIFLDIDTPRGIEAYDLTRKNFSLIVSTQGLSVSGSAKGYLWSISPPEPLFLELDSSLASPSRHFFGYRHIEGNWYLYLTLD